MVNSTIISIGLHISIIMIAYIGMPSIKTKDPIEQPIDIVDDTPISSQTSLKFGSSKEKEEEKNKKDVVKDEKITKLSPPPPPPPSKEIVDKKNNELKKQQEIKEIEELIKKKPKLDVEKKIVPKVVTKPNIIKSSTPPKVVTKPEQIQKKQKQNLAKGLLNTLSEVKNQKNQRKKEELNKTELLNKIKKLAGNSNRQVKETAVNFSQTDIDRISNHVRKYFNVSYAASEVNVIIPLKIITNLDGTVQSVTIIDKAEYLKNKFYRATADAARRAVLDSSPLPLPKGKEKLFTNMEFNFNTSFVKSY
jgi:hypothetical protein